jgi:hypothetical protein
MTTQIAKAFHDITPDLFRNLGDAEVRRGSGGNLDALRDLFGSIERASFQAGGRCISR